MDIVQKLAADAEANETSVRRKREILDASSLEEARTELRKEKKAKRQMRKSARWTNIGLEKAKGPRVKRKFMYKAGDLVIVKRDMPWHGVSKGDIGIVCDSDDTGKDYLLRYEEQRFLWVMGPRNLERWDASWVEWTEDEVDNNDHLVVEPSEAEIELDEPSEAENFEILDQETVVPLENANSETIEITEGSMIIWQDTSELHLIDADTAEHRGIVEPDVPLIVVSFLKQHSGSLDIVALYGSEHVRVHIRPGSKYEVI